MLKTGRAARMTRAISMILTTALIVSGCASSGVVTSAPAPGAPTIAAGDRDLSNAINLLYKGDAAGARRALQRVLGRRGNDATATSLLRQIDTPAVTLLGAANFAYVTRPGDSLSALAERFLGDPTLFYALAKYNAIAVPGVVAPGQTIRIPGHEKIVVPHVEREAAPAPSAPVTAKPPEAQPAPSANPRRAVQLRAAALEQMNRGAIDRAVFLLQQASRLDPGNTLIRRDLDRAVRISRAVHAK